MNTFVDVITKVAALQPPSLPQLSLAQVPDVSAVPALANIAGTNPSQMLNAVGVLEKDQDTIHRTRQEANRLIASCVNDLTRIAVEFGSRAMPIVIGALVPHPAASVGAEAALKALATEYLGRAVTRSHSLVNELMNISAPLADIASRTVSSRVEGGQSAVKELEATAGQASFAPAGHSAASSLENSVASEEHTADAIAGSSSASEESAGSEAGEKAVDTALSMVGTPYVWGGTTPQGFDCSGLTQYAYREAGVDIPRLAEDQTVGTQVSADELVKGDLVVWDGHVAMYAGDGQIVEAGDPVQVNPLRTSNMGMQFKGFWRPTA